MNYVQRLSKFTKSFNRVLSFSSTRPKPHACLATDQDQAFERPRRWSQYGGQFWFTVQWQKAGTEMTPIEVWTVNKTPGEHRPSRVVDCSRPKKADHHGPNTQTEKAARGRRFRRVEIGMCVTSSPEVRKWRHDACPDLPMAAVNASGMNAPANQLAAKYLMSTLLVDWESTLKCVAWIPERSQQTFTICGKPRYAVLVEEKQIQVCYVVVHIMTRYCNLLLWWIL